MFVVLTLLSSALLLTSVSTLKIKLVIGPKLSNGHFDQYKLRVFSEMKFNTFGVQLCNN